MSNQDLSIALLPTANLNSGIGQQGLISTSFLERYVRISVKLGAPGGVVDSGTASQAGRSRFQIPMVYNNNRLVFITEI